MKEQENKIKLLLVDDEEEFLVSSARALGRRGIDVSTANNGKKALQMIEVNNYDVIVLDVKMPGMDGDEVFRRIHKDLPDLPVILLTGHGSLPHAFESSKEGIFNYLNKPCDIEILADEVKQAAEYVKSHQEIEEKARDAVKSIELIRVLLVDDEIELLRSLKSVLQRRKMEVITVESGVKALEVLSERFIDVVVLDVKMPGMDGIKVLKRVKYEFPNIEVILLTGHPTVDTAMTGIKKGAFDYVVKPPEVDELIDTIHKAFQHRQENLIRQQQKIVEDIRKRYPE
ncbi:MAG: response regulator [Candidatus Hatepunaea meridiana]|nr:response regulator [Candidatus Hatepunaea meridiana]